MFSMPVPSAANDTVDRWVLRLPLEIATNAFGVSYKDGRVPGASGSFLRWDWVACDCAGGFDHFPNTKTFAVAQIVDELLMRLKCVEHKEMGHREVADVNVIANASAIGCRIVRAKNGDGLSLPQSDFKDDGDQMRFGVMMFAVAAPRAGCIEVAEHGISNTMDFLIPGENAFDL